MKKIKAYKGTNKDMVCDGYTKPFKYCMNKTYRHEGNIQLCGAGFHACRELKDVFSYYSNPNYIYEVELSGDIIKGENKIAASKIKFVHKVENTEKVQQLAVKQKEE